MNRIVLVVLANLTLLAPALRAETPDEAIARHLDERIKLNIKYRDEFTEEAKETSVAKDLAPLEKAHGQEWVDFLKYVKASGDRKLKLHVLRLELRDELIGAWWDLDFAESFGERAKARGDIEKWKKKLADLEAAVAKGKEGR